MKRDQLRGYWDKKRGLIEKSREAGCTLDIVKVGTNHARLVVVSPYNEKFTHGARELMGTWRPRTKRWTFDSRVFRLLKQLCIDCYGADNVTIAGYQGLLEKDRNDA